MESYSLFEYYPASGATLKDAAEDTRGRVSSVNAVIAQLEQEHRQAVASVSGTLEQTVADAPMQAVTQANAVLQQAEYAASCLELFGTDIDTYNHVGLYPRSISKLNAAYSAGLADGFGVVYEAPGAGATPEDRQAATDTYAQDWTQARSQLVAELNAELGRLDGKLDEAAAAVSTMLAQGATEANLLTLFGEGVLPPYAVLLYPTTLFSADDLPVSAQEELRQYLLDHPDLLVSPPPGLAALIAGLPIEIRTDIYVDQRMEQLRREGLLTGPNPGGLYEDWVRNTVENGVSADTLIEITRDHDIAPSSFDVLDGLQVITDTGGKSFFVLNTDMSGGDARAAVLMTYILNAGTGYEGGDFDETPYSSDEVQRVIDRQSANNWFSYNQDVGFVHDNGGTLVTTPNGMLMGAGGNDVQDLFSQQAGSTWGDIFMIGEDDVDDPAAYLEQMITSGTSDVHPALDLDRLLHHEEMHSQQWADHGYAGFMATYADQATDVEWGYHGTWPFGYWGPLVVQADSCDNSLEEGAGLPDGGYSCG